MSIIAKLEELRRAGGATRTQGLPDATIERMAAQFPELAEAVDEALGALDRLDLVKIDVTGLEPRALRGLERNLARFRPILLSEFHPWAIERASGSAPLDYLRWLRQWYAAITVLRRDGTRERCVEPEAVLAIWRRENAAAGLGERLQLDLLLDPRG